MLCKTMKKIINQNGQTLVEMAFVLPILLLVLMGIVEFGRIFNAELIITNASREGARVAAVGGSDTDVSNSVFNATPTLQHSNMSVTVNPLEDGRSRGLQVTVTTRYNLTLITPLLGGVLPNPFTITSQTTMRIE